MSNTVENENEKAGMWKMKNYYNIMQWIVKNSSLFHLKPFVVVVANGKWELNAWRTFCSRNNNEIVFHFPLHHERLKWFKIILWFRAETIYYSTIHNCVYCVWHEVWSVKHKRNWQYFSFFLIKRLFAVLYFVFPNAIFKSLFRTEQLFSSEIIIFI